MADLTLTEIQYLRGLVIGEQISKNYKNSNAMIDRKTSMFDFTEGILKKLERLEDGFHMELKNIIKRLDEIADTMHPDEARHIYLAILELYHYLD